MPTEGLVTIYSSTDPSLALWLAELLKERGIPSHQAMGGPDGIPSIYLGVVETKVMVLRSDAEAHREEILDAIRQVESELQNG